MAEPRPPKHDHQPATEVSVNWEGLAQFLGWNGSIADLKRVQLDSATEQPRAPAKSSK